MLQVSPIPDVYVHDLHQNKEQFVVLASDGLWNMVRPRECVTIVENIERRRKDGVSFTLSILNIFVANVARATSIFVSPNTINALMYTCAVANVVFF